MIKFLAFSDMRCAFETGEEGPIACSDIKKIDAVCGASSDCRFIASLGNTLDGTASEKNSSILLGNVLDAYNGSKSVHTLMGKLDNTLSKRQFLKIAHFATRYRAFDVSDYRCLFLDTCAPNYAIDTEQLNWISRLLGKSHRPAVIFSHAPLAVSKPELEEHIAGNSAALRELIEKSNKVALVVQGKLGQSDRVVSRGVPYVTLSPMYKTDEPTFAKISVSSKGITVEGFGEQESFEILKNPSASKSPLFKKLEHLFKKY